LILHEAPEDSPERQVVRRLVKLREVLSQEVTSEALVEDARAINAELNEIVDGYFYARLAAVPGVVEYLEGIRGE
jgi:hypothetical protein